MTQCISLSSSWPHLCYIFQISGWKCPFQLAMFLSKRPFSVRFYQQPDRFWHSTPDRTRVLSRPQQSARKWALLTLAFPVPSAQDSSESLIIVMDIFSDCMSTRRIAYWNEKWVLNWSFFFKMQGFSWFSSQYCHYCRLLLLPTLVKGMF